MLGDGDIGIARELATLTQLMKGLEGQVSEIKGELRQERTTAQQSRARLYNRMDDMGKQHVEFQRDVVDLKEGVADLRTDVKADIEAVNKKVDGVKAVTDTVTRWQLIVVGAVGVLGAFGGLLGVVITYWGTIRKWLP